MNISDSSSARVGIAALAILAMGACERTVSEGPPVRLVAGTSDTVILNNARPVKLPVRVLDAAGHTLADIAIRYEWLSGSVIPVDAAGVTKCAESGDATVRASLGALTTEFVVRCRPVHEVQSLRMMNLLAGGPAQDLPFSAVDAAGKPVSLLAGTVTIQDSTVAMLQGSTVFGLAPGSTGIDMRVGDRLAHASVHVYERVDSLTHVLPGQRIAVPVRLAAGELRQWRLRPAPELYFITIIPDDDRYVTPWVAVTGAPCSTWIEAQSYYCLVRQDAELVMSHPDSTSRHEARGTLAIWRQDRP